MDFSDILQIIKGYLYRQKGERDFDKTASYMEKMRRDPHYSNDHLYLKILNTKTVKKNLDYLMEVNTETHTRESEFLKFDDKFNAVINNTDADKNDSIYQNKVQDMVAKGIGLMKVSSDPFHDMGHIMRCLKLARVLFSVYKKQHNLDWGILVLAIVWHDISRSIIDTWLYKRETIDRLGKVPLLLDYYIVKDGLTDSKKSAELFRDIARENGIDQKIIAKVVRAISKDAETGTNENISKDNIYFKLHSDIDFIDQYSVARVVSGVRNVIENKKASMQFFKRSILIGALIIKLNRNAINFEESKHIYDFSSYNLYEFGKTFYPEDTSKLFKSYITRYLSQQYS